MNLPTAIVLALVATVFIAIVACSMRKKKKGIPSCSCGCSSCAMKDQCHGRKTEEK
jgi:hypothetical protein